MHDYPTAYSLAMAISASRELDPRSDFSNGIFSSLLRKILPVPRIPDASTVGLIDSVTKTTLTNLFPEIDDNTFVVDLESSLDRAPGFILKNDETLLVSWLTKGAHKRINSRVKLKDLVKWLSSEQLSRVLQSAGLSPESRLYRSARKDNPSETKEAVEKAPQTERILYKSKERPLPPPRKKDKDRDPSKPLYFSLPGRRELEAFFNEHIVEVLNEPDKYKKMGIDNPSAVILHGHPGCGKTYAVDQLVKFLDLPSFFVNSGTVASPYIHDSSKKISAIFDKAIGAAPSILVVDEMEAYMAHRSSSSSQQHQVEEVAEFLRRIPDAIDKKVIIIAMTNLLDFIDTALLRQGRFDHKIKLDLPDRIDVKAALLHILSKRPVEDDLDVEPIVDLLVRRPLSDCNYVVREASRQVVRRGLEKLDLSTLLESAKHLPPSKLKPDIGF
ncbi:MAG: ATP-binding protein [Deltaproteobacteria bacterium]|nr:ATP-binding protein [Deltaproteobacteria bacterium]